MWEREGTCGSVKEGVERVEACGTTSYVAFHTQ